MALLSERYKNDITVREQQKWHYCPRNTKNDITFERYKNDITVQEIQKITLLSEKYKNDITVREIQI
jgi:6-phosphogluconolactonase (cycloisomerase 2 family)